MSLFNRSIRNELVGQASLVFSTLVIIWVSVLLVRLVGDAAGGRIGVDAVFAIASLSIVTASPTIVSVSIFVAVLATVARSYRESEMVVWFASGKSLLGWISPVLRFAGVGAVLVACLTMYVSPWAYQQIAEYRDRFEKRSDIAKVAPGQFIESAGKNRVFFIESASPNSEQLNNVFVRSLSDGRLDIVSAGQARIRVEDNGDRFLVLNNGFRYDMAPPTAHFKLMGFEEYALRIERSSSGQDRWQNAKEFSMQDLFGKFDTTSQAEFLWRLGLPLIALNLAMLAIPLAAVNPRLGRSGDLVFALLIAFLYLNLVGLAQSEVRSGRLAFELGVWVIHALVLCLTVVLFYRRLKLRKF